VINSILNDSSNILGLQSMDKASLSPRNDGDGVAGHPNPVPQIYVYAQNAPGRGGMIDYMTYNTRLVNVLYDMAVNIGWTPSKTAEVRGRLHTSWNYLARFFGPKAEPDFNPTDGATSTACLPRFSLPWHTFGDQQFQAILAGGQRADYYEPQLLGPVTLTHSIVQ
jgi:hypothetical protein